MADGKQWYNSPQDKGPEKKKAGKKPSNPAKKTVKPSGNAAARSGKKPVKASGRNPHQVKQGQHQNAAKKISIIPESKTAEKSIIPKRKRR